MPAISTVIIAKNCEKFFAECLSSLKDFIQPARGDELVVLDTGSIDNTPRIAEEHGARVILRPDLCKTEMLDLIKKYLPSCYSESCKDPQYGNGLITDFAEARQIVTDAAKNDHIFWIDADDILLGGAALREYAERFLNEKTGIALFLPYDYSFDDKDGACNTILWRERILDRRNYHWKGACHESMIPNSGVPQVVHKIKDESCRVVHKNGRSHRPSDIRNFAIMAREYERSEWKDPRIEFYLGNACRGLERWSEAIDWYTRVLRRSGSRDDRYACALNIGYIYMLLGRQWKSIDWFLHATKIHTLEPRAYHAIGRCYHELGMHQDALAWIEFGRALPTPEHITAVDPLQYTFYPHVFACLCRKALGDKEGALTEAHRAHAVRPNHPATHDLVREVQAWINGEAVKASITNTLRFAYSQEAGSEILRRIQPEMRKKFVEFHLETTATKPSHSITFFCGKTVEPWDPTLEESGVGGSEKMVIHLARRFAKAGWRVDVYGNPKPENRYKTFDKVCYRPAESFNIDLPRDILIIWRQPALLDWPIKARKIYLDMHDVATDSDFTPERMKRCAGVFWKSKFHRSTAPSCPEDKCIYSRNGIDISHFDLLISGFVCDKCGREYKYPENGYVSTCTACESGHCKPMSHERDLQKIVYCSSGDRGLKAALLAYARIKNEFPQSSFHTFYGFTPLYLKHAAERRYQFMGDEQDERDMLDYAEECFVLMDKLGVINHGRVGHQELAAHLSTAGIWLYPTRFPEISCMSAMEAEAAGAFPIVAPTGALAETVDHGVFIDPASQDEIVNALRAALLKGHDLDDYRLQMSAAAKERFNLDTLAADWLKEFSS